MADQRLIYLIKQGVGEWNAWREQHRGSTIDLSDVGLSDANLRGAYLSRADLHGSTLVGANLYQADLREANLHHADLIRAYLRGAYLSDADLIRADLRGADLRDAELVRADLRGADLRWSTLAGANLSWADLIETRLREADLSEARVADTAFAKLDLRTVKGLGEMRHDGPSRVELYSVQLPQDGSAELFLRGAGVPDDWIDIWRSTSMHPIQYHSLFISYSNKDALLARRLHADLQAQGVRCWFAPEDMKIGDRLRPRIDEAIHKQEKLLLLLSEHAVKSKWVETEVEAALDKEQQQQREVLFPIRLDESVLHTQEAWAAQLRRQRHIGDFTGWQEPAQYQQAFARLLRDLKAERTSPGSS